MRGFFVGGNWKCNGSRSSVEALVGHLNKASVPADVEVVVAPPAIFLQQVASTLTHPRMAVSAQNVWSEAKGAFTGEISAEMVKDFGLNWTILGHSERRDIFGETDELIAKKVKHAQAAGLGVIVCIGEHLEEHKAGKTKEVLVSQLLPLTETIADWSKVVIAYEPVFCIGTGIAMMPSEAQDTHAIIREYLASTVSKEVSESIRILYGGSVNAKNCVELASKPDIDGFLVGGASLKGPDFETIINSRGAAGGN